MSHGALAQLGARYIRIVEVVSSNLICSSKFGPERKFRTFFCQMLHLVFGREEWRGQLTFYQKRNCEKNNLCLQCFFASCILTYVVTLIALKREVAAGKTAGFPWSECQVYKNWRQVTVQSIVRQRPETTGDSQKDPLKRPTWKAFFNRIRMETPGSVYSHRLS